MSNPSLVGDLARQLNEARDQREEARSEIEALEGDITRLKQVLVMLVINAGGEVELTRKMVESAPSQLRLLTWENRANDVFTIAVRKV